MCPEACRRFHRRVARILPLMASDPSELQRKLLDGPGTVTHFLETLTGERVIADVVRQYPVTAGANNDLEVPTGQAMTHRIAVLRGLITDRPYLYAESTFVQERLPEHPPRPVTTDHRPNRPGAHRP